MIYFPLAMSVLEVKFIGDGDALEHIVDKQEGNRHFISPALIFLFMNMYITNNPTN